MLLPVVIYKSTIREQNEQGARVCDESSTGAYSRWVIMITYDSDANVRISATSLSEGTVPDLCKESGTR